MKTKLGLLLLLLLIAVGCDDSTEGDPATIAWKKGREEATNRESEAAIASYTEAIRLRTNFAQAYLDRAAVYAAVGEMMSTDPAAIRIISRLRERLRSDGKQTRHLLSEAIILDLSEGLRLSPDLGLELKRSYQRTIQMRKNLSDVGMYGEEVANSELDDSSQSTPPPVTPRAPATESITNTIGRKLNLIPAGTFMMGSPETEEGRQDDEHQHQVTITQPFYMQTTEVTQGQWKTVMGTEPWKGKNYVKEGPNYPASYVRWDDAVAYCKKLSEAEGKTYRLPTEAEWEYACRAGTETTWSFGNDEKVLGDYACYHKNTWGIDEKYAHQVGLKKPNAFGLYDMHGNVWEWCHDYYGEDYYKQSPAQDPTGPTSGSSRVLRGGSWIIFAGISRSALRVRFDAGSPFHGYDFGFRLVRELD
jgi:formylglycine-generating enzyme required for sulfatase activity